jgi:hypothetical protein
LINNKTEIIEALNKNVAAFDEFILSLTKEQFENRNDGKWSAGQNLDHLIVAIKPLQPAFGLPKFMLTFLFEKANRPSRSYDVLVEKYRSKLASGGKASSRFIPKMILFDKKEIQVKKYNRQKEKLIKTIKKQSEQDLDNYVLPHPLLGKITLREMLFFTIYHNEHHLQIVSMRKNLHLKDHE